MRMFCMENGKFNALEFVDMEALTFNRLKGGICNNEENN